MKDLENVTHAETYPHKAQGWFVKQDKADFNGSVFCDDKQDAETIYREHNSHEALIEALETIDALAGTCSHAEYQRQASQIVMDALKLAKGA